MPLAKGRFVRLTPVVCLNVAVRLRFVGITVPVYVCRKRFCKQYSDITNANYRAAYRLIKGLCGLIHENAELTRNHNLTGGSKARVEVITMSHPEAYRECNERSNFPLTV